MFWGHKFRCCSCNAYKLLLHSQRSFIHSKTNVNVNLEKLLQTMPKVPRHVSKLKDIRQKSKNAQKYPPVNLYLQVVGSGAKGAARSLILHSDQTKYLFNCGEGSQRLSSEHRMKLAKLEYVFITHKSWENLGGLPGLALTVQDIGVPSLTLYGPPGMDDFFHATKKFIILNDLAVSIQHKEGNFYEDANLKMESVPILNKNTGHGEEIEDVNCIEQVDTDDVAEKISGKRNSTTPLQTEASKKIKTEEDTDVNSNMSIAYICQLQPKAGALILERCVEKGVPPGPLLGKLKNGQDVTLQDGTVVFSSEVCEDDDPGPVFIVLECPTEDYIDSLISNPKFSKYQAMAECMNDKAVAVFHFSPPKVMQHSNYKDWMKKFSPHTWHIIINESNVGLGSVGVHKLQYILHMLHPKIFPLLQESGIEHLEDVSFIMAAKQENVLIESGDNDEKLTSEDNSTVTVGDVAEENVDNKKTSATENVPGKNVEKSERKKLDKIIQEEVKNAAHSVHNTARNLTEVNRTSNTADSTRESLLNVPVNNDYGVPVIMGETMTTFYLRPKKTHELSCLRDLNAMEFIRSTMEIEGMEEALTVLYAQQEELRREKKQTEQTFPQILFLGTGSCIPSKSRNTSAILLKINEEAYMLMDCAEGTCIQLFRYFGSQNVDEVLQKIKVVYISHLHADHHLGLIGLLKARRRAFEKSSQKFVPVFLLAPHQISTWLKLYDKKFEPIFSDYKLISNMLFQLNEKTSKDTQCDELLKYLGLTALNIVEVKHCQFAYGISVSHQDGWKIVYSGDTMPCQKLVEIGQNCDLLIHEATMEDELELEATIKWHSTTSQAIQIGKDMNARFTILTHFSQRYSKIPVLNENFSKNVGIAFDNMLIHLSDLPILPLFYPPLKLMFLKYYKEMQLKTAKKLEQWRRESVNKIEAN